MTESISQQDAYARSVDAIVTGLDVADEGTLVMLDRTVFYPGGGGQPSDSGSLRTAGPDGTEHRVVRARWSGQAIIHLVDGAAGLAALRPGVAVSAEIDWPRRHLLMRTHTALHVLCGVVWRDHRALVTGGNMEPGRGRLDFELESMSGEFVGVIERRVNEEIAADRRVVVRTLPRDEAFPIPDLIRTKVDLLPAGIEQVRVIEIVGLDLQADGGTHVASTGEVGPIRVAGYESKGRINKRIRIALVDAIAEI